MLRTWVRSCLHRFLAFCILYARPKKKLHELRHRVLDRDIDPFVEGFKIRFWSQYVKVTLIQKSGFVSQQKRGSANSKMFKMPRFIADRQHLNPCMCPTRRALILGHGENITCLDFGQGYKDSFFYM